MFDGKIGNRSLGAAGEELAREHLKSKGYEIVESNFRFGRNEIDIIAKIDKDLVFVEVKARVDKDFGEPFEAITSRKQGIIRKVAEMFLLGYDGEYENVRFDVISIMLG